MKLVFNIVFVLVCITSATGIVIAIYEWITGKAKWRNDDHIDGDW